jgi:hypothetical protein
VQVLDFPEPDIVALPLEGDDGMAETTNKQRLADAELRLEQIETALGLKPPKPQSAFRQFRQHLWQQIKANKATILTASGLILAVLGWFGSGWYKYHLDHKDDGFNSAIDHRIDMALGKPGGITQTLGSVQTTVNEVNTTLKALAPFIHDVVQHQFESASKLPTATLQERLPAIQHLLTTAKDQGIKADTPILDALGRKLSTVDTKAASFWPVAADFINYRSQVVLTDIQSLIRPDLPNCTDHDPMPMELTIGEEDEKAWKANESRSLSDLSNGKNGTKMVGALYQDCRFTLDSPEETARMPTLGQGRSYVLTFRHCQMVYRGGKIALLTPDPHPTAITGKGPNRTDVYILTGQTVRFENCLFLFVLNFQPPREGQWLTEQLLAQSGSRLTVTSQKSATHS